MATSVTCSEAAQDRAGEGEWAGWSRSAGANAFEQMVGPFYMRTDARGLTCAFRAESKHLNRSQIMHGGCIMTFADFCLFKIARSLIKEDFYAVTVTLNGEFVGSVRLAQRVEGRGEVIRAGRSLIVARGLIMADESPVFSFSGTLKKIRRRR